jgi:hypothetical protein
MTPAGCRGSAPASKKTKIAQQFLILGEKLFEKSFSPTPFSKTFERLCR